MFSFMIGIKKVFGNLCRKTWKTMDFNQTKRLINQQFYDFKTTVLILDAKNHVSIENISLRFIERWNRTFLSNYIIRMIT